MKISCTTARSRFIAYLRNDLLPEGRNTLEAHLAGCSECQKSLHEIQHLENRLRVEAVRSTPYLSPEVSVRLRASREKALRKGAKMEKRRKLALSAGNLAALVVIVVVVLAGFQVLSGFIRNNVTGVTTGERPTSGGGGELITFGAYEESRPFFEELITEFNRQHPEIQVQFVPLPDAEFGNSEYYQALASAADTLMFYPFASRPTQSYFQDLQPLVEADSSFETSDFWPGLLSACQDTEGRLAGIPLAAGIYGIFFDRQAFSQAGISPPAPGWTWEDFWLKVEQLADQPAEENGADSRYAFADQISLPVSVLGPLIDSLLSDGQGQVNSVVLVEELKPYLDQSRAGFILPLWGMAEVQSWEELFSGPKRPAMWAGYLGSSYPGELPGGDWAIDRDGFAPFPTGDWERSNPVSATCVGMSAGSQKIRGAWVWLKYLSHQLIQEPGLDSRNLLLPARQSMAEVSGFWQALPPETVPAVRSILENAWFGSKNPETLLGIGRALASSAGDEAELLAALDEITASQASVDQVSTPGPVQVATPMPTLNPNVEAVRFSSLAYTANEERAIKSLVEVYNEAHPQAPVILGELKYNPEVGGDFLSLYSEQFDCFTWYPPYKPFLIQEELDQMLSLDAFFEAEKPEFTSDFYPERLDTYRIDGQLVGLPGPAQPRVMLYNADLLARQGLQAPTEDWTFEDFIALASGAANLAEEKYGYLYIDADDFFFDGRGEPWIDIELPGNPPHAEINVEGMQSTLDWIVELERNGVIKIVEATSFSAFQNVNQLLSEGRVAFWTANAGERSLYNFLQDDVELSYRVGVLPLPTTPGGAEFNVSTERGFFISPNSKNPQACWDWFKYLTEQANAYAGIPSRKSVAESPAWEAIVSPDKGQIYRQALERVPERIFNLLHGPAFELRTELLKSAFRGQDLQQGITDAQRKLDDYLACLSREDLTRLTNQELQDFVLDCRSQILE